MRILIFYQCIFVDIYPLFFLFLVLSPPFSRFQTNSLEWLKSLPLINKFVTNGLSIIIFCPGSHVTLTWDVSSGGYGFGQINHLTNGRPKLKSISLNFERDREKYLWDLRNLSLSKILNDFAKPFGPTNYCKSTKNTIFWVIASCIYRL